jgi:tetratricopeptide (TPR) repeat protein
MKMNRNLINVVIGLSVLVFLGYAFIHISTTESVPGENQYRLANKHLVDGDLESALKIFNEVILLSPEYKEAYLGKAITLMQIGYMGASMKDFNRAIELDENFAEAYANRGILNDRIGRFKEAVSDYRKAVELKPELDDGPGLVWRFLHLADKKPATILVRADYIEAELEKPESERLLSIPEIDKQQRMYKK